MVKFCEVELLPLRSLHHASDHIHPWLDLEHGLNRNSGSVHLLHSGVLQFERDLFDFAIDQLSVDVEDSSRQNDVVATPSVDLSKFNPSRIEPCQYS